MPKAPKVKVCQNRKAIHPNSRKAGQLTKQVHHGDRLDRRRDERYKKLEILGDKLRHFQGCLQGDKCDYTKQDMVEMLESYFHRFDEELEQITIVNSIGGRSGHRHASREQVIRMTQDKERTEFETMGIEVPDLLNKQNLRIFREWTGDIRYIPNIKLRRVSVRDKSLSVKTDLPQSSCSNTDSTCCTGDTAPDNT